MVDIWNRWWDVGVMENTGFIKTIQVPYTSSENSFTHKKLAFSRITKKLKNSFTFKVKSNQSNFTKNVKAKSCFI